MSRTSRARLWNGVRFLVIDLETTEPPVAGAPLRIVSGRAVSVRGGKVEAGGWTAPHVNPECDIDPVSTGVHRIKTSDVATAPTFAAEAPRLLAHLAPLPGERLVIVAHQAGFDVPVLREELRRVRLDLPDLPVLDTCGPLFRLSGVGGSRRLPALCATLGIALGEHHNASDDALATAEALVYMLNTVADAGHDNLATLLSRFRSGTAHEIRFRGPRNKKAAEADQPDDEAAERVPLTPEVGPAHIATHTVLPLKPGKRAIAAWVKGAEECAGLRCAGSDDRVAAAEMPEPDLLAALLPTLRRLAERTEQQAGETATLLGAMLPLLRHLPPATGGRSEAALRNSAIAFAREWGPILDAVPRCAYPRLCPACRASAGCPLDRWRLALAPLLLVPTSPHSYSDVRQAGILKGPFAALNRTDPVLAGAGVRLVRQHWIEKGQDDIAATLARRAMDAGSLDPEVVCAHSRALAAAGTEAALRSALAVCAPALASRNRSTEEAWSALASWTAHLEGRIARFAVKLETVKDKQGNTVVRPVRRHHPAVPLARQPRFHPVA